MTGFGKAMAQLPIGLATVEIRSLNSKFLDLNMRLAKPVQDREYLFRNLINSTIERGKVTFSVNIERVGAESGGLINQTLVKAYFLELSGLARDLNQPTDGLLNSILRFQDVTSGDSQADDSWWPAMEKLVKEALAAFDLFRETEGRQTGEDMLAAVDRITDALGKIDPYEQERIETIRKRMQNGLDAFIEEEKIDQNRFEQELIFYLEKLDVSEEKQRLRQHCAFFKSSLNEKSGGKKLGFIAQEMGREINTLGSKCNHVEIQKLVVDMKNELEKIKEQVLNVL